VSANAYWRAGSGYFDPGALAGVDGSALLEFSLLREENGGRVVTDAGRTRRAVQPRQKAASGRRRVDKL